MYTSRSPRKVYRNHLDFILISKATFWSSVKDAKTFSGKDDVDVEKCLSGKTKETVSDHQFLAVEGNKIQKNQETETFNIQPKRIPRNINVKEKGYKR